MACGLGWGGGEGCMKLSHRRYKPVRAVKMKEDWGRAGFTIRRNGRFRGAPPSSAQIIGAKRTSFRGSRNIRNAAKGLARAGVTASACCEAVSCVQNGRRRRDAGKDDAGQEKVELPASPAEAWRGGEDLLRCPDVEGGFERDFEAAKRPLRRQAHLTWLHGGVRRASGAMRHPVHQGDIHITHLGMWRYVHGASAKPEVCNISEHFNITS
jgi:hypothetical protein